MARFKVSQKSDMARLPMNRDEKRGPWVVRTSRFPSPWPSPLGRGRPLGSLIGELAQSEVNGPQCAREGGSRVSMNPQSFVVRPSSRRSASDRLKPALRTTKGSWSQCRPANLASGLLTNCPLPRWGRGRRSLRPTSWQEREMTSIFVIRNRFLSINDPAMRFR